MGHDVTVVTIQTDPSQPQYEERDGFKIYRYPMTVKLLGSDISTGLANHPTSFVEADGDDRPFSQDSSKSAA